MANQPDLKAIATATYGIVFLGTPHRSTTTATIVKIWYDVVKEAGGSGETYDANALKHSSESLELISEVFRQTIAQYEYQICSFCEEKETKTRFFFRSVVGHLV